MMNNVSTRTIDTVYGNIKFILEEARKKSYRTINSVMVSAYWEIGKLIIEEEQKGKTRAEYGKKILQILSVKLTNEFGKSFSVRNLELMRAFYTTYAKTKSPISKSAKSIQFKLSWTHYIRLVRIKNPAERKFYEMECIENNWAVRELDRQFNAALYERLALSRSKKKILELSRKGHIIEKPQDALKEPYVLEFLGIDEKEEYSESDLESALIEHLGKFLLELGKGFSFVARQKRFTFDGQHFYIDLVFYNRLLKCFVLIDLKIGELKHQDIGQMQMYVNIFDRTVKLPEENRTIGIILCKQKTETIVKFTLPESDRRIFAKEYQLYLPSKKELQSQMNRIRIASEKK